MTSAQMEEEAQEAEDAASLVQLQAFRAQSEVLSSAATRLRASASRTPADTPEAEAHADEAAQLDEEYHR